MKTLIGFIALTAGFLPVPGFGQPVTITQLRHANVFGLVQVGQQVGPVTVRQVGEGNVVGIVQAGKSPTASVSQTGRVNSAFVGQLENAPIPVGAVQMP